MKSTISTDDGHRDFPPPFLRNSEPMEAEELPLQVSLLTMELAAQREALMKVADALATIAAMLRPPSYG